MIRLVLDLSWMLLTELPACHNKLTCVNWIATMDENGQFQLNVCNDFAFDPYTYNANSIAFL